MVISWFEQLLLGKKRVERAEKVEARAAEAERVRLEAEAEDERIRRELALECERTRSEARHVKTAPVRPMRLASLPDIDIENED